MSNCTLGSANPELDWLNELPGVPGGINCGGESLVLTSTSTSPPARLKVNVDGRLRSVKWLAQLAIKTLTSVFEFA